MPDEPEVTDADREAAALLFNKALIHERCIGCDPANACNDCDLPAKLIARAMAPERERAERMREALLEIIEIEKEKRTVGAVYRFARAALAEDDDE